MEVYLESIGTVQSTRSEIRDDLWDQEDCFITLNDTYTQEALFGLEDFSHVEVIFYMNHVKSEKIVKTARHPRNRED